MRNDEARTSDHEVVECRLHDLLALRIECGGRLIENEDARILENRARYRNALPLSARDADAALADLRIIAVLQLHDEVVRVCRTCRLLDLRIRRIEPPIADILADGRGEQHRLLRYKPDLSAQGRKRHVADIVSIHGDRAAVHFVETRDKVCNRRFARTRRTDEGDHLARRSLK